MLKLIRGLPDNVVGVEAIGEVEDDDYEEVLDPEVSAKLEKHDRIRLLYVMGDEFTKFEADAAWEDAKLGAKTFTDYERIAVVTDTNWIRRSVKALGWMIPGKIHVYHADKLAEATAWVCE